MGSDRSTIGTNSSARIYPLWPRRLLRLPSLILSMNVAGGWIQSLLLGDTFDISHNWEMPDFLNCTYTWLSHPTQRWCCLWDFFWANYDVTYGRKMFTLQIHSTPGLYLLKYPNKMLARNETNTAMSFFFKLYACWNILWSILLLFQKSVLVLIQDRSNNEKF